MLEQYVWQPFYIDAPVLRDYDATTSGSPIRYYYTFDANFNITAAGTATHSAPRSRPRPTPIRSRAIMRPIAWGIGPNDSELRR